MAVGRTKLESGAATRTRLLEAAEELFAEEGFDRVSVRDITGRAGANVAAVNYHFGGRDGLLEQVIARYINPVNEERVARLDALERKSGGKPVALEEILDAFVRPFATQVRRSELSEKMFYRLMGRISANPLAIMPPAVMGGFEKMFDRFLRAFAKALPEVEGEELMWRIHFVVGGLIHMMAHGEAFNRVSRGAAGNPPMETTLARFIRFAAAGMRQGGSEDSSKSDTPEDGFLF